MAPITPLQNLVERVRGGQAVEVAEILEAIQRDGAFDPATIHSLRNLASNGALGLDAREQDVLTHAVDSIAKYQGLQRDGAGIDLPEVSPEVFAGMVTRVREASEKPGKRESVQAALGPHLDEFAAALDTQAKRDALLRLAKAAKVPLGDPGFAAAVRFFVDFGVSSQEAETLLAWLVEHEGQQRLLPATDGSKLVKAAMEFASYRSGARTEMARERHAKEVSTGQPSIFDVIEKYGVEVPSQKGGVGPMRNLDLLGDNAYPVKGSLTGEKRVVSGQRIAEAVRYVTGELLLAGETLTPAHIAEQMAPATHKRLRAEVEQRAVLRIQELARTEFAVLDPITLALVGIERVQDDLARVPLSAGVQPRYEALMMRLMLDEQRGELYRRLVPEVGKELAALVRAKPDSEIANLLRAQKTGADLDGGELLRIRRYFNDAPGPARASPATLEAHRLHRRRAFSFWANERTARYAQLSGALAGPHGATAHEPAARRLSRAELQSRVETILREQCFLELPQPIDPKAELGMLGLDSLQYLQLGVSLNDEFGLSIKSYDDGTQKLRTLASIVDEIERVRGPAPATGLGRLLEMFSGS
jgi:acyl carrier protein